MIHALICVSSIILANIITGNKHNWPKYLIIFVGVILFCLGWDYCHSFETPRYEMKLNNNDVEKYMDLCDFHQHKADMCIAKANEISLYLPNATDRDKSMACLSTILASIAPPTPMSKIVAMAISLLGHYAVACMDEWHLMQQCLHQAKYHYEMLEFYQEVLIKA